MSDKKTDSGTVYDESDPLPITIAKRRRHNYLLQKIKDGEVLSIKEIGELKYYENKRNS